MSLPVTPTLHHTELHTGPQTQLAFTHLRDFPNALPTPTLPPLPEVFPQFNCQQPRASCDPFLPPTTVFLQHAVYSTSALLHHQVIICECVCN